MALEALSILDMPLRLRRYAICTMTAHARSSGRHRTMCFIGRNRFGFTLAGTQHQYQYNGCDNAKKYQIAFTRLPLQFLLIGHCFS
jgi:hypothetical protein